MTVTIDGSIWKREEWVDCPIEIQAWDDVVTIKLDREGYDDEQILLSIAMLEYAIKAIKSAPDYESEGGAA